MVVKRGKEKQKHVCVVTHYNRHMSNVHKKLQLFEYVHLDRKRMNKYYTKLFRRLVNATVLNSLVIYGQKSRFPGLFQHSGLAGLLYSCPNKFPHSSPEAPRIIEMCETSTSEGGNYPPILPVGLNLQESSWDLLHAAKLGHIILLPLRRKAYWGFFRCPKNPTASARFEPANSGSSGQYANH
jgi:hypothetical protein